MISYRHPSIAPSHSWYESRYARMSARLSSNLLRVPIVDPDMEVRASDIRSFHSGYLVFVSQQRTKILLL